MNFGITYDQLRPVANSVRAGIVPYDPNNPAHDDILRHHLPKFISLVNNKHGHTFPFHHLDTAIDLIKATEVELHFCIVALDTCSPIMLAAIATGSHSFGLKRGTHNHLFVVPERHGEELAADPVISKIIRERTKGELHPKGIGTGTIVWNEQEHIWRSFRDADPNNHWDYEGRENEHTLNNGPMIGLMDKTHGIRGGPILELRGLTSEMERRWGIDNIVIQDLPSHVNGGGRCQNNFLAQWKKGKQDFGAIFNKISSVSEDEHVIWTKIESNGNYPRGEIFKEVLTSLVVAGYQEISSPERRWGAPRTKSANDLGHIFGARPPVMHLASRDAKIIEAFQEMGVPERIFGREKMVFGFTPFKGDNISGSTKTGNEVRAIERDTIINQPHFDFLSIKPQDFNKYSEPARPSHAKPENDNLELKVA